MANSNETIQFAGEYLVEAIELLQPNGGQALDIRNLVSQVTIYEDIFSPFMSGNLICKDTNAILTFLDQMGLDIVHIRLRTPSLDVPIDKKFHVYKLDERIETNERTQQFILHFISIESIVDNTNRVSKQFKGNSVKVITDLLKMLGTDKPLDYTPAAAGVTYVSNFWPISKNIDYVTDMSIGKDNDPSYVFFENNTGFNFKTLVQLSKQKPFMEFDASNYTMISDGDGNTKRKLELDWKKINSYKIYSEFDYLNDIRMGMINYRMISYDINYKRYYDKTDDLSSEKQMMNDKRSYPDFLIKKSYNIGGSTIFSMNKMTGLFDSSDPSGVDTFGRRNMLLRSYRHKIEIEVLGRTDFTIGKTVLASFNKAMNINKSTDLGEVPDKLISGKYLVSAICHRFLREPAKHEMTVELIRDSIK